jgi:hypothetical protein
MPRDESAGSREGRSAVRAIVTNVNTGGQWIVVTTISMQHGPFDDRVAAEEFAAKVTGAR